MNIELIHTWREEMANHLTKELLPFWTSRCWDGQWGGFLTQYDEYGNDSKVDEKSLLAHMRIIYSMSLASLHGFDPDGTCLELARKGVHFAIDRYWDPVYGGFYWLFNRKNEVLIDKKIVYGLSFAIYACATYSKASCDPIGLQYAEKVFDLLQTYCTETSYGGYWEMFERDWRLCGPASGGGDRKTLDVHMHLMEAFTALYRCSGKDIHRRKLLEIIEVLDTRILHPVYRTPVPQFWKNWQVAPQIKFDIVWGWDRFTQGGQQKEHALDTTSYGHNVEYFWLLLDALRTLGLDPKQYDATFRAILNHATSHGIDYEYGGVFVEGAQDGSAVYDMSKEFWQQAEFLIGMLDAYMLYDDERYLEAYKNVHTFVMEKVVNHDVGEWRALLERDGKPVWRHMSHSWKVNYHTIRSAVLTIERLDRILLMKQ